MVMKSELGRDFVSDMMELVVKQSVSLEMLRANDVLSQEELSLVTNRAVSVIRRLSMEAERLVSEIFSEIEGERRLAATADEGGEA